MNSFSNDPGVDREWIVGGNAAVLEFGNTAVLSGDGPFVLTLTNTINGCSHSDSVTLQFTEVPFSTFEFEALDESCLGFSDGILQSIQIDGGTGMVEITLNDIPIIDMNQMELSPNNYTLTAIDDLGCRRDTSFDIRAGNFIDFELGDDIVLLPDENVNIAPEITADGTLSIFEWVLENVLINNSELSIQIGSQTGEGLLSLYIEDENGCNFSDSLNVSIAKRIEDLIYIPNAFAPISRMGNETLLGQFSERIDRINSFLIYDRWGELVLNLKNFQPGMNISLWDGRVNGNEALSGVYVYLLDVTLSNGEVVRKVGDITLVR
jgi:hypothetical protein